VYGWRRTIPLENGHSSPERAMVEQSKMKITSISIYLIFGFLGAISLLVPTRAMAQAAPGPLPRGQSKSQGQTAEPQATPAAKPKEPAVPPRTTLAGAWKLNRDQSDDGRQRVQVAEGAGSNYPGGGSPGGGYPGGGYPGGGYPGGYPRGPWGGSPRGGGGGPNGGPRYDGKDIEDNPRIQSLIYPAESLTVDLKNPEIDVTDDRSRKLILYTDGRQLPKSSNDSHQEVAAHWDGSMLVSDEKGPLGGKMNRTFELSNDGRQLYETLHIDNGRSGTPITIRYVYDVPTSLQMQQNREDSDPNRPVLKRHSDDSGNSSQ
jgi:hypothetical protein